MILAWACPFNTCHGVYIGFMVNVVESVSVRIKYYESVKQNDWSDSSVMSDVDLACV